MISFGTLVQAYHVIDAISQGNSDECLVKTIVIIERHLEAEDPERYRVWKAGQHVVCPRTASLGAQGN